MWSLDTYWFDVAVMSAIFAVGNITLGHFEAHRPLWRRLGKGVLSTALFLAIVMTAGRPWAYGLLALMIVPVVLIHAWWLPKNGVNGWTGEPRERYYELIGHRKDRG